MLLMRGKVGKVGGQAALVTRSGGVSIAHDRKVEHTAMWKSLWASSPQVGLDI